MSRRTFLAGTGLAGLGVAGLLWRIHSERRPPGFTVQTLPIAPREPAQPYHAGLQWIAQIHLETLGPTCVLPVPGPEALLPEHRRAFQLEIQPERRGHLLALSCRWRRRGGSWSEIPGVAESPHRALGALIGSLPEPCAQDDQALLIPRDPPMAWRLLELAPVGSLRAGQRSDRSDLEALLAQVPGCATAWCLLGMMAFQDLFNRSRHLLDDRARAESAFRKALEILPDFPMAAGYLAQMLSDLGDHPSALQELAKALPVHPHSEMLLRRLAYSARNAGLLNVALSAVDRLEQLSGHYSGIENTLLYSGEIDRFEAALRALGEAASQHPAARFYLGYAALLEGKREEAASRLLAPTGDWSPVRFGRLGFATWSYLKGNTKDAHEVLESLEREHLALSAPDGEFIIKLAELEALMGDSGRALDLVNQAASHGFTCIRWYEQSPFLSSIRGLPRFQAILATLRERHAIYERRFPPQSFGL